MVEAAAAERPDDLVEPAADPGQRAVGMVGASVIRLVGAVLADMHDEWQAGDRRYLSDTSMAEPYPTRDTDHVAELEPGD